MLILSCFWKITEAKQSPQLLQLIPIQSKSFNSRLKILCSLQHGTEPIDFEWWHNDLLIVSQQNPNYRIESTQEDSLLIIERLSSNDSGNYSCIARNDFGSDRQQTKVIVTGLRNTFYFCLIFSFFFNFDSKSMCGASNDTFVQLKFNRLG